MITIVEASPSDVNSIRRIAEESWWPAYREILPNDQITYMLSTLYSEENLRLQLESGSQTYLLLYEEEKPVAFAAFSQREEKAGIFKLHKLYCLPETQGKGYGKSLIEEVSRRVSESGATCLELNVNRHNRARTFYERMGFSVSYKEDIPIGNYWMNDFVMQKKLSSGGNILKNQGPEQTSFQENEGL